MIDFHCMHAINTCVFDEIARSYNWKGLEADFLVSTRFGRFFPMEKLCVWLRGGYTCSLDLGKVIG